MEARLGARDGAPEMFGGLGEPADDLDVLHQACVVHLQLEPFESGRREQVVETAREQLAREAGRAIVDLALALAAGCHGAGEHPATDQVVGDLLPERFEGGALGLDVLELADHLLGSRQNRH